MQLEYGLDDRPPWWKSVLFGLQWSAVLIPSIVTLGRAVEPTFGDPAELPSYLQRLFLVSAVTLIAQIFRGHKLPVMGGPAAILLVAVLAAGGKSSNVVATSMLLGGVFLILLVASGMLRRVRSLFTDPVIAVVLLLVAFTLLPTTLRLLIAAGSGVEPSANLGFGAVLLLSMFVAQRVLPGIWRSTVIVWAMLLGSGMYFFLFPSSQHLLASLSPASITGIWKGWSFRPSVQPGTLLAFLFCYVALAVNDLSSIQSVNRLLQLPDEDHRVNRGMVVTGLSNILSGLFGVVGSVNYSLSPGVILSTGCASRFTLLPAAAVVATVPFLPGAMWLVTAIPSVVIGCVLLFVLVAQVAAGLSIASQCAMDAVDRLESGLVIGLPVVLGTITAFLPVEILETFPVAWRPILGNGFVLGIAAALLLEHVLFRESKNKEGDRRPS